MYLGETESRHERQTDMSNYQMSRPAESALAADLRGLSHERLAVLCAALATSLARIADERVSRSAHEDRANVLIEHADDALRNSGFEPVQSFAPSVRDALAKVEQS